MKKRSIKEQAISIVLRESIYVRRLYLLGYSADVGFALADQATYFLEQAGLSSDNAFDMSMGSLSIGFVGGIVAWLFINRFGRRPLYTYGLAGIFVIQIVIGF